MRLHRLFLAPLVGALLFAACQSTTTPRLRTDAELDGREMVQPPRLQPGDTIMFVAPAGDLDEERMMRAKERLEALGYNSVDYVHVVTEAKKLAFADRNRYVADPRHVDVPTDELLSKDYAAARRELIRMDRAMVLAPPGDPGVA